MSNNILDLKQDSQYDMIINRGRTLKSTITCQYVTGTTPNQVYVDFDFSSYSGATLEVQASNRDNVEIISFSTTDGSLVLSTGSTFQLIKTAAQTDLRSGEFIYNMVLHSADYPQRQFLSGKFIIEDTIKLD